MISTHMCIFRLPASLLAPLNAFRVNVLNISQRFQIPQFSIPIRTAVPLPVSRLIQLSQRPVPVPFYSPLLFPSALPSDRPVAAIIAPPVVS